MFERCLFICENAFDQYLAGLDKLSTWHNRYKQCKACEKVIDREFMSRE